MPLYGGGMENIKNENVKITYAYSQRGTGGSRNHKP